MAERLQIIIDAKDQFSGPFKRLRSSLPSLRTAALAVGAAFAGIGAASVTLGSKVIKLASDMEETTNKFNVVFKDQIVQANKWADEISNSYFTSSEEARRFLSSVQDLLVPMGLNAKAAGELSNQIVRLSADLGSFNNLPTERVISDIQSALVGNYETVKKYGVVLTATAVQQRALNDGLAESADELTVAQKATTAYKIILESSKNAVGDMARSSQSWANQSKLARAQLTDIGTEIGSTLLPVASQYLIQLNQWIKANKDLIVLTTSSWLKAVAKELQAVGRALIWVDDNITDRILDFFYGPSKDPSKLDLLQMQLKKAQENVHDFYLAMAEGEPVDENFLKLQKDKIALLNFEIAALKGRAEAARQKPAEVEQGTQQLEPISVPVRLIPETATTLPFLDDTANDIKALQDLWAQYYQTEGERAANWYREQVELHSGSKEALAIIDDIYAGKKSEIAAKEAEEEAAKLQTIRDLHDEYFATELERLASWYEEQKEQYSGYKEEIALLDEVYAERKAQIEEAQRQKELAAQKQFLGNLATIATAFGKKGFKFAQAISIAQATMSAYEAFNKALASVPYPFNLVAAATTLAAGLAQVAQIVAQKPPAAHGGLDFVPSEQTFLLDRGERVVSPRQNRDLTEFLQGVNEGGFGLRIDNFELTVTAPAPIQDMSRSDWQDVAEVGIIPAMRELSRRGIKP